MYAIVKVGGRQYRVEKGDTLLVDRLRADEGDKLPLEALLYADGSKTLFDGGDLKKVRVDAVVRGHERGPKLHILKFKPKKGYKRRTGHRSELTRIEIGDIKLASGARKRADTGKPKSASPRRRPAGDEKRAGSKSQGAARKPSSRAGGSKRKQGNNGS